MFINGLEVTIIELIINNNSNRINVISLVVRSQGLATFKTPFRNTIGNFRSLPYPHFDAIVQSCWMNMNPHKLKLLHFFEKLLYDNVYFIVTSISEQDHMQYLYESVHKQIVHILE
jgi:hypothetical protein